MLIWCWMCAIIIIFFPIFSYYYILPFANPSIHASLSMVPWFLILLLFVSHLRLRVWSSLLLSNHPFLLCLSCCHLPTSLHYASVHHSVSVSAVVSAHPIHSIDNSHFRSVPGFMLHVLNGAPQATGEKKIIGFGWESLLWILGFWTRYLGYRLSNTNKMAQSIKESCK